MNPCSVSYLAFTGVDQLPAAARPSVCVVNTEMGRFFVRSETFRSPGPARWYLERRAMAKKQNVGREDGLRW